MHRFQCLQKLTFQNNRYPTYRKKAFNIHNQILTKLVVHSGISQKLIPMKANNEKLNKHIITDKIAIILMNSPIIRSLCLHQIMLMPNM